MSKKQGATKVEARNPLLLANGQTLANPEVMRRALKALDVSVTKNATPEALLDALRATVSPLVKKLDPAQHCTCDDCGEVSTPTTDYCPFCGSADADDAVPVVEGEPIDETPAPAPAAKSAGKKSAIAPIVADGPSLVARAKELDAIVETIKTLAKNVAVNSFDLGVEIKKIHADDLWKARGHASFKEFVEKDLEMTRTTAYHLMDLTKKFDRPTFEKVGASKLQLIASIEDQEKRDELLADAKAGATKRTLERKAGKPSSSGPGKAPAAAAKQDAPPKKGPNDITLLTKVGSKAEMSPFRSVESKRPVKAFDPSKDQDLYIEIVLSEDVVLQLAHKKERDGTIIGMTHRFVRTE